MMSIKWIEETLYEMLVDLTNRQDENNDFPKIVQASYDLFTYLHEEKGYPFPDEDEEKTFTPSEAFKRAWQNDTGEVTPFEF